MARKRTYTASYLVKIEPERLDNLRSLAESTNTPLAEAFREGAERYLTELSDDQPAISNDLRRLARQVDRNLKGGH